MATLDQIQRGIQYIEEHLEEEIALRDVATEAGMSSWHFQRSFKALTQETLKTYIRARRLANALERLRTTETRIIEIALAAGYESQEAFSRAFKQVFDITPHQYRELGGKNQFPHKVQLSLGYLEHIERQGALTPELLERGSLYLVGLHTNYYGVDSEKNNLAAKLPALWQSFLARMAEVPGALRGMAYGVIQQAFDDDQLSYTAAVAVAGPLADGAVPIGMVALTLPPACYAQFEHRGPVHNLDHTVDFVYSNWLLTSGERHTHGADLELYGAAYHPTSADSIIHYAVPVVRP
jgi:AraC-like DNA-binding protein/predicted transcriptional regulator YdeE